MAGMDETQPLLGHVYEQQSRAVDRPLVEFDPHGDPENPLDWPNAYKWGIIALLAFMAFTVTFTCIGVVPVADQIVLELDGRESKSASVLLVTIWELGEAAGPLLIAPLSEVYGRYPVFNVANVVFIFGVTLAAFSQTANAFIFARFVTGLAVASNVLNPAIIGDIFRSEERGSGMSLIMLAPLLGGAIGPAISGALAQTFGWRVVLCISAGVAIICETVFFLLLRETYSVTILRKKAAKLRQETDDKSLKCAFDTASGDEELFWSALRVSVARPITMLSQSAVLQILSFYGAIMFSLFYVLATTMPDILKHVYGLSPVQAGAAFPLFSVGSSLAVIICNAFLDKIYIALGKSHGGVGQPEYRLPFAIIGGTFLPPIVAFYGWVPHAHWPVSLFLLAFTLVGLFMLLVHIPLSSYVVDAFGIYSASAMTMVLIARCLGGTLLPLAIPPLTDALGLGYGFAVFAAILVLLIPLPIVVMRYGQHWRQHSPYTRSP